MKPLAPNTLLQNRYLIVHLIGKGGMGDVYLAVDQRLGSAIALKRTFHGDDPQLGDAFEREARTLARLRHPALPKVSDHFTENDNQYLVMEHIAGDDLASRLKSTAKPFPLSWVLYWADQLLDALAYLHSHEPPIIHRDIKPQNLKLTDDNNIVLLDFGLSKNSTGQASFSDPTGSTGSVVGYTPHYAPMEQIRGTGTNPKSDIYALSATLYQLLTNVVPPDALTRADFLLGGKTDPIAPINEVNSDIPREISDVVLRGMSISQDQRFADAREMQKVLRETYAKLQKQQADKTVAFNAQVDEPIPTVPPVGAETVPFAVVEVSSDAIIADAPEPVAVENSPADAPNLDATIVMDAPTALAEPAPPAILSASTAPPEVVPEPVYVPEPPPTPESLQSNVKTEVFIAGVDLPAAATNFEPAPTQMFEIPQTPSTPQTPPTPPQTPNAVVEEEVFSADKTVPLINFENMPQTAPEPVEENFEPAPAAVLPPPAVQAPAATPKPAPKPVGKKKTGMLVGILLGLVGLGVLAVAGVVGAWFYMNQSGEPPVVPSTPTPTPVVTATPTPTPTATPEDTNANVGGSNTSVNSNVDVTNSAPTPETTRPGQTAPTPVRPGTTPKPNVTTPSTPRPNVTKPTPKPEVKPTQRGTREIVQ